MKTKPAKEYTIYSDWPNWADQVYSELYFNQRLRFNYIAKSFEKDLQLVDENIKKASVDSAADFILIQKDSYERNKAVFQEGFSIIPMLSSNSKELYLIKRKSN
jgi:hypothetical protein